MKDMIRTSSYWFRFYFAFTGEAGVRI